MLTDACLGRTLDWLDAHDPTRLFAGIARRARQVCGVSTAHVHVDTTSFSVSGDDAAKQAMAAEAEGTPADVEADPALIAITSGSSRDHREDLTPWMLALATTHDGDRPLCVQPLSGTSSDNMSVLAAVQAIQDHWRATDEAPRVSVAEHGVSSDATMRPVNQAKITWISRVSDTSTQAKHARAESRETWHTSDDGSMHVDGRIMTLPQGHERWVIVRTTTSEQRAHASVQRQVKRAQAEWEKTCWHLGTRRFACEADARAALQREHKGTPAWLDVQSDVVAHAHHEGRGRPRTDASPLTQQWQIVVNVTITQDMGEHEASRNACWIGGTTMLSTAELADQALAATSKEQGGVERGFRVLNDPLFLASSVCVNKPERIMALSLIMVVCVLISRVAECRLRTRLAETAHTIPDQIQKPPARPTMRWVFPCFEGIEVLPLHTPFTSRTLVVRLQPVHQRIFSLLGPYSEQCSLSSR
jgi:transposase